METGTLYGVGVGPGAPEYLTLRGAEVLRSVDVIFTVISRNASDSISRSVVEALKPRGEIRQQTFSMSRDNDIRAAQLQANADEIIQELRTGRDCAFATLGDPMTYSTFGYILRSVREKLPEISWEIVPGITSFASLCAKSGTVLVENDEQLRLVPSFCAASAASLEFPKNSTTVLLKTYHSRTALLDRLAAEDNIDILYGEKLTMKGQAILNELSAIRDRPEEYLSMIMVKKR